MVEITHDSPTHRRYAVRGQVFFVSANQFAGLFAYDQVPPKVTIDVSGAHIWDTTAVGALDKVVMKFRRNGATVEVVGQDLASQTLIDQIGHYPLANAAHKEPSH